MCFPKIASSSVETSSQSVTRIGEPMIRSSSRIPLLSTSPFGTTRGFMRASAEAERTKAEAERARRTAEFFQTILLGVDPAVAQGSDTTLFKSVLDDTAARVGVELVDAPQIEATLRDTMTSAYFAISEHAAALEQAQRALSLYEAHTGPRSQAAVAMQCRVGVLKAKLGDFDEAERLLTDNLALSIDALGAEHFETHVARTELAIVHLTLGRGDAAAELFEQVLSFRRQNLGDDDPQTLIALNGLELSRLKQHRDAEGEAILREVLVARQRVNGATHPETIKAVHNLAGALATMERFADAEALYRESLDSNRRILGAEHEVTLDAQSNLAMLLRQSSRYDESIVLQAVVEVCRRRFGDEDPRSLEAELTLARIYRYVNRLDEAVALLHHCYQGRLQLYGQEHPHTLDAMSSLVAVLARNGEREEADLLREPCVELHRRVLGDQHEDTLIVRHDLGVHYMEQGELARAETLLREVVATSRRVLGDEKAATLRTLYVLTNVLQRQKRYAESVPLMGEFLDAWSRIFGDQDAYCAQISAQLIRDIPKLDVLGPVEPALRTLRAYQERTLEAGTLPLLVGELWLTEALVDLGRHDEAVPVFEAVFERWNEGLVPARSLHLRRGAGGAGSPGGGARHARAGGRGLAQAAHGDAPGRALRRHGRRGPGRRVARTRRALGELAREPGDVL